MSADATHPCIPLRHGRWRATVLPRLGGSLGRLDHLRVGGFAGDHDEDGGVRQQVFAPQLVEQVLARHVGALEVVVAQDDVVGPLLEGQPRFRHTAGLFDVPDPEIAQLCRHHAARRRVAVDDQGVGAIDVAVD